MAGTFAAEATARGVQVESLELDVEGVIDLNRFCGLQPVPAGLSDVRLTFRVRSDADPALLPDILQGEGARSHSPVFDTIIRPIMVETALEEV